MRKSEAYRKKCMKAKKFRYGLQQPIRGSRDNTYDYELLRFFLRQGAYMDRYPILKNNGLTDDYRMRLLVMTEEYLK